MGLCGFLTSASSYLFNSTNEPPANYLERNASWHALQVPCGRAERGLQVVEVAGLGGGGEFGGFGLQLVGMLLVLGLRSDQIAGNACGRALCAGALRQRLPGQLDITATNVGAFLRSLGVERSFAVGHGTTWPKCWPPSRRTRFGGI